MRRPAVAKYSGAGTKRTVSLSGMSRAWSRFPQLLTRSPQTKAPKIASSRNAWVAAADQSGSGRCAWRARLEASARRQSDQIQSTKPLPSVR
jgi:hypothetical protein